MRIALIGDLQYWSLEDDKLHYKMSRISDLDPEFAVIMGDLGGSNMRNIDGYKETADLAGCLNCPYHVILGNHDVEYAPGEFDRFDPSVRMRKSTERITTEPWS